MVRWVTSSDLSGGVQFTLACREGLKCDVPDLLDGAGVLSFWGGGVEMARYVGVSSISFPGVGGGEDNLKRSLKLASEMIESASWDRPDLIALPETFNAIGVGEKKWVESAEPVPGPTTDAIGRKARRYGTYIACPIVEKTDDGIRNSMVLIDRRGEVVWKYHKFLPTIGEMDRGVIPGTSTEVFETDFGRIGAIICFDLNFLEILEGYKKNKPEIILFCSAFRGGFAVKIWAYLLRCFIVSSTPVENSLIVNPVGRILAESSVYNRVIFSRINLDCLVVHIDYNHPRYTALKKKYKDKVELEILSPEAVALITSHHKTKSIWDFVREFEIEPLDDYFDRARAVRRRVLKKR